jgi:membrane fusion protein, multidrug efflux system
VPIAKSIWLCASVSRVAAALLLCAAASAGPAGAMEASGARKDVVRGIVRSVGQAMISTDLQTRVAKIGFQEGQRFNKGDTLVLFDCGRQQASLAGAEAQQLEMQLTVDKNKVLQRLQAVGKNDLEIAEARVAKASADVAALRAQFGQCTLVAPYDGRVLELGIQEHETPQPGKPFIGIVSEGNLEIDLIVPSAWASWVKPGFAMTFSVDETQGSHLVSVTRIGAAVDPISQTIKIVATFTDGAPGVLPGMSGSSLATRPGGVP